MKKIVLFSFALISLLNACEKNSEKVSEQTKSVNEVIDKLPFGNYSKELVVYDKSGENSALVKIGTDDLDYFNMLTQNNLTLIPVKKGQTAAEAVNVYCKNNGINVSYDEIEEDTTVTEPGDDEITSPVYSMILSKSLADDVENVILVNNAPSPTKGWKYDVQYGYAPLDGVDAHYEKATFCGQNNSYVGYYGLTCMKYSVPQVSTLVSNYKQIRTGETDVYEHYDCLVMTAYLKFKGTNNPSVIVMFKY